MKVKRASTVVQFYKNVKNKTKPKKAKQKNPFSKKSEIYVDVFMLYKNGI